MSLIKVLPNHFTPNLQKHKDISPLYCRSFCLTVYLRVKYGGKLSLKAKKVIEQKPEFGYKICFSVTKDRDEESILLYYLIDNHLCKTWSIGNDLN